MVMLSKCRSVEQVVMVLEPDVEIDVCACVYVLRERGGVCTEVFHIRRGPAVLAIVVGTRLFLRSCAKIGKTNNC